MKETLIMATIDENEDTQRNCGQLDPDELAFKDQVRSFPLPRNSKPDGDGDGYDEESGGSHPRSYSEESLSVSTDTPIADMIPVEAALAYSRRVSGRPSRRGSNNSPPWWVWHGTLVAIVLVLGGASVAVGIVVGLKASSEQTPPTVSPTQSPTMKFIPKPITDRAALLQAVDDYLEDSDLTLEYGATINDWDVSRVTDFSVLFDATGAFVRNEAAAGFNDNIGDWDVSNAVTMLGMFDGATSFNQDLAKWNVSSVRNMNSMFLRASAFNQDLSSWDMGSVENTVRMFAGATRFNQDLSQWNVSSVTEASWMFATTRLFNQDLCDWGTQLPVNANVEGMFSGAGGQDGWNLPAMACPSQVDPTLPNGPLCHLCNSNSTGS